MFLINRIPYLVLSNNTPYELLKNKTPYYDSLKVFGCLCYNSTSTKQRHMFSHRAKACYFLGYLTRFKGYKLLNLETHTVFISRNVVFHEGLFRFAEVEQSTNIENLFGASSEVSLEEEEVGDGGNNDPLVVVADSEKVVVFFNDETTDVSNDSSLVIADSDKVVIIHSDKAVGHMSSSRKIKSPSHLQGYHYYSILGTTLYPIYAFLIDANLSLPY